MVAKSTSPNAAQAASDRLEKTIASHRSYFADWRSEKFDRLTEKDSKIKKSKESQIKK
jgi:hypothetical protein